jgi:hypothetical protein
MVTRAECGRRPVEEGQGLPVRAVLPLLLDYTDALTINNSELFQQMFKSEGIWSV